MENISVITQSQVNVRITSSANSFGTEKRFPKDLTIGDFKVCCNDILLLRNIYKHLILISKIMFKDKVINVAFWKGNLCTMSL